MDKFFKLTDKFPWKRKPGQEAPPAVMNVPDSISRIPLHQNLSFAYREEDLVELEQMLAEEKKPAVRVVLSGPNGIGKTDLAMAYCLRNGSSYSRVDWLQAARAADYRNGTIPHEILAEEETEEKATNRGRLIILEDVEDPEILRAWIRKLPKVRMLITSPATQWPADLKVKVRPVERFHRSESIQLLRQTAPRLVKTSDSELDQVVECLCDLPLAINLTGRYLASRPRETVSEMLTDISRASESLQEPIVIWAKGSQMACADGVAALFTLLLQELGSKSGKIDRKMLVAASHCAPGSPIPIELLRAGTLAKAEELEPALQRLFSLGLLINSSRGPLIHPLLSEFTQLSEECNPDCLNQLASAAVELGVQQNQLGEQGNMPDLWVHIHGIAGHAEIIKSEHTAPLWNNLGYHWWSLGELQAARACLERGLSIDEATLGADHPDITTTLSNLGRVYYDLHELQKAKTCFMRAMVIDEKAYSSIYPSVATDAENLGMVLSDLGERHEALTILQKALHIYENAYGYGPKHPTVSHVASKIGHIFVDMGNLLEARTYFERALAVDEWVYGPTSVKISDNLGEIGRLQREMGEHQAALATFERLLNVQETAYGEEHELLAPTLNNLGLALQDTGTLTRARDCFERALSIDKETYGPDHINIARDANNLGSVLRELGNLVEARKYFEQALMIDEKHYGSDHPHVGTNANNLGRVLYSMGDLEDAKQYFARVLAIDEKNFGSNSLEVATDLNNLGIIANDQRNFIEARPLFERALAIFSGKLPSEHAKILKARKYLERAKRKISTGSLTNKIE